MQRFIVTEVDLHIPNIPVCNAENHGVITYGNPPANCVVVITGLARTGTTDMAGIVATLMPLFCDHWPNAEDYNLSTAIERGDKAAILEQIIERPDTWAFKRPFIYRHTEVLLDIFGTRLCWLVMMRDSVATAIREQCANGGELSAWLNQTRKNIQELECWFEALNCPRALVSYEKLLTNRGHVRAALGNWLYSDHLSWTEKWCLNDDVR